MNTDMQKMIDDTDKRIILELQHNGRVSYAELSAKLHLSISSISRRINRLVKGDIIMITAIPDPKRIGMESMVFIGLDVELTKIDEVCDKIAKYSNVHHLGISFGRFDVILWGNFPSSEHIVAFIKSELSHIDGVKQIETFFVAELKKRTYGWLTDDAQSLGAP